MYKKLFHFSGKRLGQGEFVSLMAFMNALAALSVDATMPAFPQMEHDLHLTCGNHIQLVIIMLFAGLSAGQLVLGPMSDTTGRKPPVIIGMILFCAGSLFAIFSHSFWLLMTGRFLQGFGLAGPRAAGFAMMRDLYKGSEMAKIISFIIIVFMLVPVFAPSIGQLILFVVNWRILFFIFMMVGVSILTWFTLRQGETLAPDKRVRFTFERCLYALKEVVSNKQTLGYTLASGLLFAAFDAYLSLAQPMFYGIYRLGNYFPVIFALMAIFIAIASVVNSRFVTRIGASKIASYGAIILLISTCLLSIDSLIFSGRPPLWQVLIIFPFILFASGILFGNQNALAMEPIGHVAGMGAAMVTSISSIMGVVISLPVINHYKNSITPLALLFWGAAVLMILLMRWANQSTFAK